MGYNLGLAVGLAIGIPCFIILIGGYLLWNRNRRRNKKEDMQHNDIDVELRDNNLFTEFGEALHKPYENGKTLSFVEEAHVSTEKHPSSTEEATLSRGLALLPSVTDRRKIQVATPDSSVLNQHRKTPLSYAFYDTFIPIMPEGMASGTGHILDHVSNGGTSTPRHNLAQPPAINGERLSVHSSSNTSFIGGNSDSGAHSLDNLAKQLNSPQFFEKLPLRAATVHLKQRLGTTLNNLSSDIIHNTLYDRQGINDNYVYEVGSSPQKHPYYQRAIAKESLEYGNADRTVDLTVDSTNIENNFDNNIAEDAVFDDESPDVVFK